MHHADAGADRCSRLALRQLGAVDQNSAGIRHVMAEEDAHQRGLAGTVLAKQRHDLALGERQRDVVIGQIGAEALADAFDFENRTCHAASPATGKRCCQRSSASSRAASDSRSGSWPIGAMI